MLEASRWPSKSALEVSFIFGNTVGNCSLKVRPDELIRVEFRGIAGEEIMMNASMSQEEFLDDFSLMNGIIVPKYNDWASEVLKKIGEKFRHFSLPDVLAGMIPNVEAQVPPFGRDADPGDRGDFIPVSCDHQSWGPTPW